MGVVILLLSIGAVSLVIEHVMTIRAAVLMPPQLGLLGTVIGMIIAFHQVAETQGAARAGDLAEGIYLSLVTTVEGLIVAIPALAAFACFEIGSTSWWPRWPIRPNTRQT